MPDLTARRVTAVLKAAGFDLIRSSTQAPGVIRVEQLYAAKGALTPADTRARREARARLIAGQLIAEGYEAARIDDRVTVTLPEPIEDAEVVNGGHAAPLAEDKLRRDYALAATRSAAIIEARDALRATMRQARICGECAQDIDSEPHLTWCSVPAGHAVPLAEQDAPRQDAVEALLDEVEARAEQQHADDEADREANAEVEVPTERIAEFRAEVADALRPAVEPVTPEQVADAILDRRPLLDLFPGVDREAPEFTPGQARTIDAGVTLATERLAARYGTTADEVVRLGRDVIEETLAPADESGPVPASEWGHSPAAFAAAENYRAHLAAEPGPEVDDPREQPAPVEWSEVAEVRA